MAESPAGAERPNVFTSSYLSQAVKTGTASDAMWEAIWFGEVTDPKDLCPKTGVIPTSPTHLYTSDDVALARFTSLFHHTPGELSIAQIVGIVVGVLGAVAAGGWAASQAGLLPALG